MLTKVKHTLERIDKLLASRKYTDVIDRLLQLDISSLCKSEIAYRNLMLCRAYLGKGDFNHFNLIQETVKYYRSTSEHNKFARIKFCQGLHYIHVGETINAKESFTEAFVSYKRIDDREGQAIVLNRLAGVQYVLGDIPSTIEILKKSLALLNVEDWKRIIVAKNNIVQIYLLSGSLSQGQKVLDEIASIVQNHFHESSINYTIRQAAINCLKGNYIASKKVLRSIEEQIDENQIHRFIYNEYLGWVYNQEGKYSNALAELKQGLQIAIKTAPESLLTSQIKRRMADSYFGLKDYKLAELFAGEALTVAEKLNERVEIAECWRIQAEIANHNQEAGTAKELFKKAIDMFNMIGTKYNLAACRYIAATSGLYHNGERQALLYLAREYFESESVTHYIKKIDTALSRPQAQVQKKQQLGNSTSTVIAAAPVMRKIIRLAEMIAPSPISVLLTGETGTGKDHLAKFIHDNSECEGEFVAVNIAAIPETMLEAELFGYRKGAFTGADQSKPGLFEQADNGTFFLNEVSAASAAIQAKLLDVLERRKIRRLGENTERDVSFRLLSASNRDLEEMIRQNEFRADLYHRIKQEEIKLSPLRERSEDIPEFIRHFLAQSGADCTQEQAQLMTALYASHTWPGNVRELKAEIERLAMMNDNSPAKIIDSTDLSNGCEIEQMRMLLEKHNWNRSKVASELGISEGGVRYRMRKFKLL